MRRRALLAGAGAALAASAGPGLAGAADATSASLSGRALYDDVKRYGAFGPKRTAGEADHAVSRWMASEARRAGAEVELRPFAVEQFALARSTLTIGGRAIDNQPFWRPRATAGVLRAPATADRAAAAGKVLLVRGGEGLAGLRDLPGLVLAAAQAKAAALVVITPTASGQYFGHGQREVCAVPTLLVGDRDRAALEAAAATGAEVALEIAGVEEPKAQAFDVIARMPGMGPLTVVSTPTSAWTTAAAERGPGVALWLGLVRAAMRAPRGRPWLFVAFSGHELAGAGARAFVSGADAPAPDRVRVWCHLGASIAARRFERGADGALQPTDLPSTAARLLTNRSELVTPLQAAFAPTPFRPALADAAGARGELSLYFGKGFPTFGFEGSHDFFHAPGDTADKTSAALLAPVGAGLDQMLLRDA